MLRDPVVTWAALSPLALPDLPEGIRRRLVEEHLLDPKRFWLPVPPPSVSAEEARLSRRDHFLFLRRYWRGPTWVNAAWLLWLGPIRLGYTDPAAANGAAHRGRRRPSRAARVLRPFTGEGMGATSFSWSALVMELADPHHDAAASHVGVSGAQTRAIDHAHLHVLSAEEPIAQTFTPPSLQPRGQAASASR